jgi:hypothetical protein
MECSEIKRSAQSYWPSWVQPSGPIAFFVPLQHTANKEAQNREISTTEQKEQSTEEVSLKT